MVLTVWVCLPEELEFGNLEVLVSSMRVEWVGPGDETHRVAEGNVSEVVPSLVGLVSDS